MKQSGGVAVSRLRKFTTCVKDPQHFQIGDVLARELSLGGGACQWLAGHRNLDVKSPELCVGRVLGTLQWCCQPNRPGQTSCAKKFYPGESVPTHQGAANETKCRQKSAHHKPPVQVHVHTGQQWQDTVAKEPRDCARRQAHLALK
eukprot:4755019-Amphidinium_carterae.1